LSINREKEALAIRIREYIQSNRSGIDAPFIQGFPRNCCESASMILGVIFDRCYPDKQIQLIESKAIFEQGMHFWIEVDELVYDITCDQFSRFSGPIIGGSRSSLSHYFSVFAETSVQKKLIGYDWRDRIIFAAEHVFDAIRANA